MEVVLITAWESVVGEPWSLCDVVQLGSIVIGEQCRGESLACGELELRNRFRRGRHHVGLLWPVTGRTLPIGKGLDALRPHDYDNEAWRQWPSNHGVWPKRSHRHRLELLLSPDRHRFAPSPGLAVSNGPRSHPVIKSHPNSQHHPVPLVPPYLGLISTERRLTLATRRYPAMGRNGTLGYSAN